MKLYGVFETYSDLDGEKHEYCHGVFSTYEKALEASKRVQSIPYAPYDGDGADVEELTADALRGYHY